MYIKKMKLTVIEAKEERINYIMLDNITLMQTLYD